MILHEDKKKFHSAIQMAAEALKIKPHFVEKDYWICRSLQQMVRSDASHHAIFKGGTSLTKANPHNRKKIGYAELRVHLPLCRSPLVATFAKCSPYSRYAPTFCRKIRLTPYHTPTNTHL